MRVKVNALFAAESARLFSYSSRRRGNYLVSLYYLTLVTGFCYYRARVPLAKVSSANVPHAALVTDARSFLRASVH